MLWKVLALFLVLWSIVNRWKRRKLIALSNQLSPKNIALPFIGHSYLFLGSDEDRMKVLKKIGEDAIQKGGLISHWQGSRLYIHRMKVLKKIGEDAIQKGGLISHWQGSRLYILIAEPVAAEVILKTCLEKDDVTKFFRKLIGNGSIFAAVSVWRSRRKVVAPTFALKNLINFVEVFARQSNILVNQLKSAGNEPLSIWKYLATYTMDSVCETALGVQVNAQLQPEHPFLKSFEDICAVGAKRLLQPWLYNKYAYRYLSADLFEIEIQSKEFIWNFIDKIISTKREALTEGKSTSELSQNTKQVLKTFLELILASSAGDKRGKVYNNIELREETLVIVLAGTDTTAVGTAFAILLMAKYPHVQERVYNELQVIFGDSDRPITSEDLPRLKYLDAVIRETLRLYPPVPFIVRKVQKDLTLPSGVTLVEGCSIFVSIFSIHRNPEYWGEDAEQYRPERILDTLLKHHAAYMPFSHGPRNCLGYQYAMSSMKTVLATMLRRYVIKLPTEIYTGKDLRIKFDIMMKHVDDYMVELKQRN